MVRSAAALSLAALLVAAGAAKARTADFDCASLLMASTKAEKDLPLLRLEASDGVADLEARNPVSATEMLAPGGNEPIMLESLETEIPAPDAAEQSILLACRLIIVEFRSTIGDIVLSPLDDSSLGAAGLAGERVPILLIGAFKSIKEANDAYKKWKDSSYNIKVFVSTRITLQQVALKPESFYMVDFLKQKNSQDARHVAVIQMSALAPEVSKFLADNGVQGINTLIALCGPDPCADTGERVRRAQRALIEAAAPVATEAPPAASVATGLAATATGTLAAGGTPSLPPTHEQRVEPPSPPLPEPDTYEVRLRFVNQRGEEKEGAPFNALGGLDCALHALGAEIFVEPPTGCAEEGSRELRDSNALIETNNEGLWRVVAGARLERPETISVELPLGQPSSGCVLDLELEASGGKVTLALNPVANSSPPRFEADVTGQFAEKVRTVNLAIRPKDPASCGGPGRQVNVAAKRGIVVPLLEAAPIRHGLAWIVLAERARLESELRMNDDDRSAFARAILAAIEGAHARLAYAHSGRAWPLVRATVQTMQADATLQPQVDLVADALRGGVVAAFAAARTTARKAIAEAQPALSQDRLRRVLNEVVIETEQQGIDRLTVILVAPIPIPGVSPCVDPRYAELGVELGPKINVAVFPLAAADERSRADLASLAALAPRQGTLSVPSGAYACLGAAEAAAIYPFFVEHWRATAEIPARYAAALADGVTPILDSIIAGGEFP